MPGRKNRVHSDQAPVTVEIDELVLHGFPSAPRDAIAAAFGDRLVELIREYGAPLAAPDLSAALNADAFSVTAGARPDTIGRAAARSVYQVLRGGER